MIEGTMVVDVHNHIEEVTPFAESCHFQSTEQLIARMDSNCIDMAVVFPRGTLGYTSADFEKMNDYVIRAVREHPDRLIGFCYATPVHRKAGLDDVERCAKAGLKGIKLLPHKHGFYDVDGVEMNPLVEVAQSFGLVILTHSDFNTKRCTPYQVVRLAKRFPRVRFIMAHFGMDSDKIRAIPDIVEEVGNVYLDTSCTPNMPEAIYARPIERLPDRILFGSDTPTLSPEVELFKISVAQKLFGLTVANKRRILGENAARLFNIR